MTWVGYEKIGCRSHMPQFHLALHRAGTELAPSWRGVGLWFHNRWSFQIHAGSWASTTSDMVLAIAPQLLAIVQDMTQNKERALA